MTRSDTNPHWVCAVGTLIPLAVAALLVWHYPAGPRPAPPAVVATN